MLARKDGEYTPSRSSSRKADCAATMLNAHGNVSDRRVAELRRLGRASPTDECAGEREAETCGCNAASPSARERRPASSVNVTKRDQHGGCCKRAAMAAGSAQEETTRQNLPRCSRMPSIDCISRSRWLSNPLH